MQPRCEMSERAKELGPREELQPAAGRMLPKELGPREELHPAAGRMLPQPPFRQNWMPTCCRPAAAEPAAEPAVAAVGVQGPLMKPTLVPILRVSEP